MRAPGKEHYLRPHFDSKGFGIPVDMIISAPYYDYRQQKLEIIFRSLLVEGRGRPIDDMHPSPPNKNYTTIPRACYLKSCRISIISSGKQATSRGM